MEILYKSMSAQRNDVIVGIGGIGVALIRNTCRFVFLMSAVYDFNSLLVSCSSIQRPAGKLGKKEGGGEGGAVKFSPVKIGQRSEKAAPKVGNGYHSILRLRHFSWVRLLAHFSFSRVVRASPTQRRDGGS